MTLDLKSPSAQQVLEKLVKWADVLIVNTPHPARKRLKLEYDDVVQWNPRLIYADVTGFGDKGPDYELPGFDVTAYWARSGLLSQTRDAGAPPTWPMAASGDHATAVGLFSAIVMGLYRRERTGKGSYVTTSLLAEGVWAAGVSIAGALAGGTFHPLHDRESPSNATLNPYKTSDGRWFLLVVTPDKLQALATGIGRPDLIADPRFSDPAKQTANAPHLRAILDDVFAKQPWRQCHARLLEQSGRNQTHVSRRHVSNGRHRLPRRRRLFLHPRPRERHDRHGWRECLFRRSRSRYLRASCGFGSSGFRNA
jgi:formyl-CoA transferase